MPPFVCREVIDALRAAANVIYEPIFAVMLHVQTVFGDVMCNLPAFLLTPGPIYKFNVIYLCFFFPLGSRHLQITQCQRLRDSSLDLHWFAVINSHTSLISPAGLIIQLLVLT